MFPGIVFDSPLLFPGKWHLGLNCESSEDHCHHPSVHGFDYFFGIPLTNLRDCRSGHGTVFQFHKYIPYRALAAVLVAAGSLCHVGAINPRGGRVLGLLGLAALVTGLAVGFVALMPYLNCVLMRNHLVVEQPFASENLTQRTTREAVDFLERYDVSPSSCDQETGSWFNDRNCNLPTCSVMLMDTNCLEVVNS